MTWGWQPHKYTKVSATHKFIYGTVVTTCAVRINEYTAFKALAVYCNMLVAPFGSVMLSFPKNMILRGFGEELECLSMDRRGYAPC